MPVITDEKMPKVFITSDTHFNHENIIKYCNRPFASVVEMNQALIDNWNRVVRPQDTIIHCGDFAFTRANKKVAATTVSTFVHKLNGRKILILGNHDNQRISYRDCGFGAQFELFWVVGSKVFCHCMDWVEEADKCGRFIYYGHVHDNDIAPNGPNWKNVCVEQTNYTPVDITANLTDDEYRIIVKTAGVNNR